MTQTVTKNSKSVTISVIHEKAALTAAFYFAFSRISGGSGRHDYFDRAEFFLDLLFGHIGFFNI